MTQAASILVGARAIAKALSMGERTVRRKHAAGELPTFQTGNATSPIKLHKKWLPKLRCEPEGLGA